MYRLFFFAACVLFVACASKPERAVESMTDVEPEVEESSEEQPAVDDRVDEGPIDLGLEGEAGNVQINTGGSTASRSWRCSAPKQCEGLPHQDRDGGWQCEENRCVFRATSDKVKPIDLECAVDFDCPTHEYRCAQKKCVER